MCPKGGCLLFHMEKKKLVTKEVETKMKGDMGKRSFVANVKKMVISVRIVETMCFVWSAREGLTELRIAPYLDNQNQ